MTNTLPLSADFAKLTLVQFSSRETMPPTLDRITIDPEVCMGLPTIRGLRITVAFILKQLVSGMTVSDILHAYPELEEEDVRQAVQYAAWLAGEATRPLPTVGEGRG